MSSELSGPTRRNFLLASATGMALPLSAPVLAAEPAALEPLPRTATEALARLVAGNSRFVEGQTRHAHQSSDWRKHLVEGQKPFATILGCSDSRVPPELVFDQGLGDLFVIRVAGNVIASDVIGSLAYASNHLNTMLFVVLGHAGCGAVTAAIDAKLKKIHEPERIEALLKLIEPGLTGLDFKQAYPMLLNAAVEANVRWSIQQLSEIPQARQAIKEGRITLAGAVYELKTGRVRFLKPM